MHDWLGEVVSQLLYGIPSGKSSSPEDAAGLRRLFWIVGIPVAAVVITIIIVRTINK